MNLQRARDNYLRYVAIERGLSQNTVAAYTRDIDAYLAWLGERGTTEAEAITLPDVSAYVQWLATRTESPLTSSSQSRTLSSIKGFHKFMVEENIIENNVTADVNPPKLPKRLPKAITVEQMSALIAATDGDDEVRVRD
ncbi:MAG: site-specific integrase, partial [Aurantimicrobium sp.]